MPRLTSVFVLLAMLACLATGPAMAGETLDSVQLRNRLACGVSMGLLGYSMIDAKGRWSGMDADICRAIAAAVLGDADKVTFVPLDTQERFPSLQTGEIDVLIRQTTCTFTRDTAMGLSCAGIHYYDGQGFMVKKGLGVDQAKDLKNPRVCVQPHTTTEQNLADFFATNGMKFTPVHFTTDEQMATAFENGQCQVLTNDKSALFSLRQGLERPQDAVVLPDTISKEPLGPLVRSDDDQWFKIVKWTVFALINAEEMGVSASNAAQMKQSENPNIQHMLGVKGDVGKKLGLNPDWAFQAIRQVGNYGEIYERNLGSKSALKIERGLNELWNRGGILYAPPIR